MLPVRRHSRKTTIIALVGLFLALLGGGAVALALSQTTPNGFTYVPQIGFAVPNSKLPAAEPTPMAEPAGVQGATTSGPLEPIPAHILPAGTVPAAGPSELNESNGWLVSDGATLVAVYAGSAGDDATNGRFVIVRQTSAGSQTVTTVDVPNSGAVSLDASNNASPGGTPVIPTQLSFTAANGVAGTLDLTSDTATVTGTTTSGSTETTTTSPPTPPGTTGG
jgi:hypothetical protein